MAEIIETHERLKDFYLQAVEDGDEAAVEYALQNSDLFDINGKDYKGRSSLILAINNDHIEILRTLLYHGVRICDAFLYAIDEGKYEAVKVFCQFATSVRQSHGIDLLNIASDGEESLNGVTPLVKAGQCNDYHITKLLLEYGAVMPDPGQRAETSLELSLTKLHIYQAVSSEAYISLTSQDPIGHAFQSSSKLRELSVEDYEFREEYSELSLKCEQFAADLLSQTRDKGEITAVLTYDPNKHAGGVNENAVNRAFEAVQLKQKRFIAHAHCQQFLIGEWYRELRNTIDKNRITFILSSILIAISYPLLSLCYLLVPKGKLARFTRIPYVKFVMHSTSYLTFLVLLLMTTFTFKFSVSHCTSEYSDRQDIIKCLKQGALLLQERGPPPTLIEWLIILWVVAFTWREIKELWRSGLQVYISDYYNIMDWCQLSLYWCVIALRIVAYLDVQVFTSDTNVVENVRVNPLPGNASPPSGPPPPSADPAALDSLAISKRDVNEQNSTTLYNEELLNELARLLIANLTAVIASGGKGNTADDSSGGTAASGSDSDSSPSPFSGDWWLAESWYDKYESDVAFSVERTNWSEWDPTLLSECLFAVANIVSVLRILRLVVIDRHFGPMQISMTKIAVDIFKFFFLFSWVWIAFSLGMTQVYWSFNTQDVLDCYEASNSTDCDDQPFASFGSSMITLLWSLFDLMDLTNLDTQADHKSTEGFGAFIYAMYMIIAFTVLLNLLIAVMSNTYNRIEENSDIEWKFYRAEMWMSYFDEGATLPVPFNIIPSPKSVFYLLRHIVCCYSCRSAPTRKTFRQSISKKRAKIRQYQAVVMQLVKRHFASKSADQDDDNVPVTVSDFKEFREETVNYRNEVFRLTTLLTEKMERLEQAILQSELLNTTKTLRQALLAPADNINATRRSSRNLKEKMLEQVQRHHLVAQSMVMDPGNQHYWKDGRPIPYFNQESKRKHRESRSRSRENREYGPHGTRNGVPNPSYDDSDIVPNGEYVTKSDISMMTTQGL
ncbi:short transient receptor potential channel 4-like [Ptychodera flava]|uniref:short transient receptor potential channel 4-like n=1 Tax=Ptychodera flava TaxID=63121 RepID=UPI003969FEE3